MTPEHLIEQGLISYLEDEREPQGLPDETVLPFYAAFRNQARSRPSIVLQISDTTDKHPRLQMSTLTVYLFANVRPEDGEDAADTSADPETQLDWINEIRKTLAFKPWPVRAVNYYLASQPDNQTQLYTLRMIGGVTTTHEGENSSNVMHTLTGRVTWHG